MRQLVKATALLAGMLTFGGAAFAQCKIAVVSMQDAVLQSNDGKANAAKYEARTTEWQTKLDKIKADTDTLTTKRKQQGALGSQSVLADLDKQIADKNTALNRMTEDAQKDVDAYRDELLSPVMMTAQKELEVLANEKNYSLIYDVSAPNSPVVYSSKDCNITEELKKRMNAKTAGVSSGATGGTGASSSATGGTRGTGGTGASTGATGGTRGTGGTGANTGATGGTRGTGAPAPAK